MLFIAVLISVRKIQRLSFSENHVEVKKADVPLGSISKTNKTLTISGNIFSVFSCQFSKDINNEITVYIPQLEDYYPLSTYKKL